VRGHIRKASFGLGRFPLAALLVLPAAACAKSAAETPAVSGHGGTAATPPPPISATVVPVREIRVPRVLILSGSLTGSEQAQVAAGAAGKVLATYVERGSQVKKGALLARIDARLIGAQASEAAAQVESLRAQQAQAKLDCDRTQRLFEKGAIAKAEFDRSQTQCVTAKWSVAAAEARKSQTAETLRDTQIRAPFSGMVVDRAITAGEYVRPDSRVVTLVGVDALRVELTVPEADLADIKQGMAVDFRVASRDKGQRYRGRIRYIGPAVRQASRDAVVEAIVENQGHELRPGMFVTAEVALGERALPAVPAGAIRTEDAQKRVFVVDQGRVQERIVQVAEAREGNVPIVGGVKVGEQVIAPLTPDVRDGAQIK